MLNAVDDLDLASYALTRIGCFSERTAPRSADIETWIATIGPPGRVSSRSAEELSRAAARAANPSYALASLCNAASQLIRRNEAGWELAAAPSVITALRWRLPLGTAHAAAAAAADSQLGSPPSLASNSEFSAQLKKPGAVDGHVHVGACLPFDGLFQLLLDQLQASEVARRATMERAEIELYDSEGKPYELQSVLAFAAALADIADAFLAAAGGDFASFLATPPIDAELAAAIADGQGWDFFKGRDPSGLLPSSRRSDASHRYLQPRRPDGDPYEAAIQRKFALLTAYRQGEDSKAFCNCVEDLLRCEALLHTALTQGYRAGLSEFLVRARLLGRFRSTVPDRARAVIRHGLPHLCRGMRLRGVELRTAEQNDGHRSKADLARSIDSQLAGYQDAMKLIERDNRPMATWPICLIKDESIVTAPDSAPSVGGTKTRFDLRKFFTLIDLTADLLASFPNSRKLISGLDVAGDENAAPNWCFALLFRRFREQLSSAPLPPRQAGGPLSFRVHAGEDFLSPLQGLRRIDEAVRLMTPQGFTPRIGHGLALSRSANELAPSRLRRQPIDEAFDDLVWAWSRLKASDAIDISSLLEFLAEAIMRVGLRLYGDLGATAPEDFERAYLKRFEDAALRELGLLSPSAYSQQTVLGSHLTEPASGLAPDRILFAYLTRPELGREVETPLLDTLWLTQLVDATRPLVRKTVVERSSVVEVCPTSNVVIGGLESYQRHPVHEWAMDGLRVTVNTDDPGLFSVVLADEYACLWSSSSGSAKERAKRLKKMQKLSLELMDSCQDVDETAKVVDGLRREFAAARISSEHPDAPSLSLR